MRINLDTFKIPANYVLIKPDEAIETYQIKGKELGIIAPDFKYEGVGEAQKRISVKERNASVSGTVYQVPQKLVFNLNEIKSLKNRHTTHKVIGGKLAMVNFPVQFQIDTLTRASVQFKTEMELEVGDRVNFSYMAHQSSLKEGLEFETDEGLMYLIKYDMLYYTLDGVKPKKMLNGWVIVEPEEIEVKTEGAQEFIEHQHGIVTLAPKSKLKKSRKNQIGEVKIIGSICKGYLQEPDKTDPRHPINVGEKILYDPRNCQRLEYENHQNLEKIHHLVQRKDITLVFEKGFDFSKLELTKKKVA